MHSELLVRDEQHRQRNWTSCARAGDVQARADQHRNLGGGGQQDHSGNTGFAVAHLRSLQAQRSRDGRVNAAVPLSITIANFNDGICVFELFDLHRSLHGLDWLGTEIGEVAVNSPAVDKVLEISVLDYDNDIFRSSAVS